MLWHALIHQPANCGQENISFITLNIMLNHCILGMRRSSSMGHIDPQQALKLHVPVLA